MSNVQTIPPPKQKPVAPIFFAGRRRLSSVTPHFMSATKREVGTPYSAAIAAASSGNDPVPLSSESRSIARAE